MAVPAAAVPAAAEEEFYRSATSRCPGLGSDRQEAGCEPCLPGREERGGGGSSALPAAPRREVGHAGSTGNTGNTSYSGYREVKSDVTLGVDKRVSVTAPRGTSIPFRHV